MLWSSLALVLVLGIASGAASAAGPVTAFDEDGTITVNGVRTVIIGTYYYATKYADEPREKLLAEAAAAGFNLVRSGTDHEELDAIHAAGLMAWVSAGTLDLTKREESEQKLRGILEAVKDHPALAFIESVDEPAWTWKSAAQRVPAEAFSEAYPVFKEVCPDKLLYMNHAPTNLVKTMRAYNAGTDIVAMDIYPVNPGGLRESYALFEDGHQGDLNNVYLSQVGEYVDKMRRVTGPGRPLFMVLQAFSWEMLRKEGDRDPDKILYPTYADSRFMAFQSLIKGANGIVYWGSHYTPPDSQCWPDVKRVVREVADLAGPLAERTATLDVAVDYHEVGHSVDDGVQTLAKLHKGKLYLFTSNADRYACKATLSGLDGWKSCSVLNEERSLTLEAGSVTDEWRAFDVHLYEFAK